MGKVVVILVVLALILVGGSPVQAQDDAPEPSSLTAFNRTLVDSVEKGCIYIWAMSPENPWVPGFMMPLSIGSGVIFMAVPEEEAAYALTNHHVAWDTSMLQVETWDRATYKAQMVATDPGIDCALIRIENIPRDRYEPCVLGNSDNVVLGEAALAVGAPGMGQPTPTNRSDRMINFGLHQTTTMAVVSGRSTNPYLFVRTWAGWRGPPNNLGQQVMTNCPWRFVTQSPISPGNSGGPLFNAQGEIIGLNHAHFGGGPTLSQHENYTIPVNFCKNFAFQILDTGIYELPWFGMDMIIPRYIDDYMKVAEFVERFSDSDRLIVFSVRRDSPAERAIVVDDPHGPEGLRAGDEILEFDGRVFTDLTEFRLYVFTLEVGKTVPLQIRRGKLELDLEMEVGAKRNYDSEFSI